MCERQEANKAVDPTPTFAHRVFQTFSALVIHAWFDYTRHALVLGFRVLIHTRMHIMHRLPVQLTTVCYMDNCFQIMTWWPFTSSLQVPPSQTCSMWLLLRCRSRTLMTSSEPSRTINFILNYKHGTESQIMDTWQGHKAESARVFMSRAVAVVCRNI